MHMRNETTLPEIIQGGMGIGMQLMKYRALAIGAFLEITSAVDAGTTIHVVMKSSEDEPDNING